MNALAMPGPADQVAAADDLEFLGLTQLIIITQSALSSETDITATSAVSFCCFLVKKFLFTSCGLYWTSVV